MGMEFARTEMADDGSWIEDEDQIVRLKANYVISAFGSGLRDTDIHKAMDPVKVQQLTSTRQAFDVGHLTLSWCLSRYNS